MRVLAAVMICVFAMPGIAQMAGGKDAGVSAADGALQRIYKADEAWRRARRGGVSEADEARHVGPEHLAHVDAATQAEVLAHEEAVLARVDGVGVKGLSGEERLNFEVYRAQLVVEIHAQKARDYEMEVNSDSAFWSGLTQGERANFRTVEEYERYLSRLRDVPVYFDEQMANMRAGLARGFTAPKVTLVGRDVSIKTVADAKGTEATAFWKPFVKMPSSIPVAEQQKLRAEAAEVILKQVIPAYAKLLAFFDGVYLPGARETLAAESLPDGKHYYRGKILEFATVEMSPEEIHAIGLKEMEGIHGEMLAAIAQTGFKGSFAEFLEKLRTGPEFYAKTPEELLWHAAWIAKEFDGVAGRYFGYEPRGRFAIVPVPPEIAPYYTSARGGTGVYLVNTYDLPSRGLYSLTALTLHESAPGHSWQGAVAQEREREKKLPEFRKAYISAYGEGWALYCERLGTEMGMYHTPYETFGMLSYQAWRAARLVVDTGVHAQGWTREEAQAYLHDNTALSQHEIETEVDRYISWPGQALSYYLGEMAIVKERKKAEAALGAKFSLRAFHDAVLETGSVPLPVLEEHLDAWIAGGGMGPFVEMEK
jgi:uncharacterized protein (DUF885 family)